ncbi:hypothetical protein ACHELS_000194 [Vibrio vulnificus]|uniref:hypothetical protein n=1 Tax=Vibrio vulnificus TaxID=672 RepID=UPI001A25503F|nr:protein-PII uridylyltransferase [Vibrio vulnificus]ELS3554718.1 hypothetical protein [Vibrio vulnificus]ELS3558536.1 hypothetical protein [Vibrio vulnificus]HAT8527093.1 protein-PII uridylyltransferase [Vibrio vulnificus]HAT8531009.1 protein-PII uridylyltransferase [Vibrio vulnificus]
MSTSFLYIDDDEYRDLSRLISKLDADEDISIEHVQVMDIPDVLAKYKQGSYSGFIIDQELTKKSQEGKRVPYHGTTLAQHLRTEMTTGTISHCPIILLSNNRVIVETFKPDDTSADLFDYVIVKDSLTSPEFVERAQRTLKDVVAAYQIANKIRSSDDMSDADIQELLSCDASKLKYLDSRFKDFLRSKSDMPHAIVSLVYSTLVRSAGTLVTEKMLATKLGVEIDNSDDWARLVHEFSFAEYRGIFANLKPRWWMSSINQWWYSNSESGQPLQSLSCEERVDELKEIYGYENLKPIKIKYAGRDQSDKVWVNCVVSGTPLDPYDALRARDTGLMPWEQPKYLDILTVLNREHVRKGYKIHSDDIGKRDLLKSRLVTDGYSK